VRTFELRSDKWFLLEPCWQTQFAQFPWKKKLHRLWLSFCSISTLWSRRNWNLQPIPFFFSSQIHSVFFPSCGKVTERWKLVGLFLEGNTATCYRRSWIASKNNTVSIPTYWFLGSIKISFFFFFFGTFFLFFFSFSNEISTHLCKILWSRSSYEANPSFPKILRRQNFNPRQDMEIHVLEFEHEDLAISEVSSIS
jgi:hypothetical protein